MNMYKVMIRYSDTPGSAFGWTMVSADNPFQAISMARSMYGTLLISASAVPC